MGGYWGFQKGFCRKFHRGFYGGCYRRFYRGFYRSFIEGFIEGFGGVDLGESNRPEIRLQIRFSRGATIKTKNNILQIRFPKVVAILFVRFWSSRNSFRPGVRP